MNARVSTADCTLHDDEDPAYVFDGHIEIVAKRHVEAVDNWIGNDRVLWVPALVRDTLTVDASNWDGDLETVRVLVRESNGPDYWTVVCTPRDEQRGSVVTFDLEIR